MRNLKVFVYGTLREGRGNHPLLGPTAVKVCDGTISARLYMVHTLPMITHAESPDDRVVGEVWELDGPNRLADVDALEGHPNWYRRQEIPVHMTDTELTGTVLAWAYFMRPEEFVRYGRYDEGFTPRLVTNGDYCNPEIGWSGDEELCPVCRIKNSAEDQRQPDLVKECTCQCQCNRADS